MSEKEVNPAPDAGTVTQTEDDVEAHNNPTGVTVGNNPVGANPTGVTAGGRGDDADVEAHVNV